MKKKRRVHSVRLYLYKILENANNMQGLKSITEHSWGLEGVRGYDFRRAQGTFWGKGYIHYFHYGTGVL